MIPGCCYEPPTPQGEKMKNVIYLLYLCGTSLLFVTMKRRGCLPSRMLTNTRQHNKKRFISDVYGLAEWVTRRERWHYCL
jgi:hypothetical protein